MKRIARKMEKGRTKRKQQEEDRETGYSQDAESGNGQRVSVPALRVKTCRMEAIVVKTPANKSFADLFEDITQATGDKLQYLKLCRKLKAAISSLR